MADLKGINLAMQTPFNENGAINYSIFEDLIEQYVAAGVHGLVLGAGTGQHPYLTEAECNRQTCQTSNQGQQVVLLP